MTSRVIVEGNLQQLPAGQFLEPDLEYPERLMYEAVEFDMFPWGARIDTGRVALILHEKHIDNMELIEDYDS